MSAAVMEAQCMVAEDEVSPEVISVMIGLIRRSRGLEDETDLAALLAAMSQQERVGLFLAIEDRPEAVQAFEGAGLGSIWGLLQ